MLQGLESIYDTTRDYSQRNYSDKMTSYRIAGWTTRYKFSNGHPQLAMASWSARRASYPIQALSSPATKTLHQAAKSEYLLWGQEQTGTIHSPAPAKDHSEQ